MITPMDTPLDQASANRPEVAVFIATSLDGFIARPDGAIDWLLERHAAAPPGEDFGYAAFMAGVDALVMGRSCLPSIGAFEIFELEHDAEGRLTRLALDLEVSCGGAGAPVTSASLRLNSTRPPPP